MGINATEWAAYSAKANLMDLNNASGLQKTRVTEAQDKKTYSLDQYNMISKALEETRENIEEQEEVVKSKQEEIEDTKEQAEKDVEEETLECLSKEITVDKFCPNQGMNCGMGMGMGDKYTSEGAITLTVEELNALDGVLADFSEDANQTDNSEKIASHLNSTLTSGATATAGTNDDGTKFVEIRRANGSSVKICDANGNGALDVKDYAFCDAIKEAKEVIEKMNAEVASIESTAKTQEENLTMEKEEAQANIEDYQAQAENYEMSELPNAQAEIDKADEEYTTQNQQFELINTKLAKKQKETKQEETKGTNKDNKQQNFFANGKTNPINANEKAQNVVNVQNDVKKPKVAV